MRDQKRCDPVRGQSPALRCADGFRADELTGQDEGYRAEAESEAGDKGHNGNRGENGKAMTDAKGQEERTETHTKGGREDTGSAAEGVD